MAQSTSQHNTQLPLSPETAKNGSSCSQSFLATPQPAPTSTPSVPSLDENIGPKSASPSSTRPTSDSQHYGNDKVLILFQIMKQAGYGDRSPQKKSLKNVFTEAVKRAEKQNQIKRTAKGWQKKFTRIKQEYAVFITKLRASGREGDDADLYDKPEYFEKMHELENVKARYDQPAQYCTEDGKHGTTL